MKNKKPFIAVLLAAYDGEYFIEQQVNSILNQKNVNVDLFISIDQSSDRTLEICQNLKEKHNNIFIVDTKNKRFGSAGENFYFLFREVNFERYDFIALSDQDDIWKPNKLQRASFVLSTKKFEAYSSDVECFWDNKKRKNKIIKKSYPQKKYDFIFEPAGPGCTYVLSKKIAHQIKEKIQNTQSLPLHHDWFIYAYARQNNLKWHIDNQANIFYRQHTRNQVGANIGIKQYLKRFSLLRNGSYTKQIKEVQESIGSKEHSNNINSLIFKNPFQCRRNNFEACVLIFFALLGTFK